MTNRAEGPRIARILLFAGLLLSGMVFAQERRDSTAVDTTGVPDSLRMRAGLHVIPRDTALAMLPDSLHERDSLTVRYIDGMGSLQSGIDSTDILVRRQFDWTDAKYAGELLWRVPGINVRELGETGPPPLVSAFGLDERYISILLDGRPLNNPVTGRLNLYDLPLEFIDHLELFTGPDALRASGTASATTVNAATRWFNTLRPVTAIRFVQDPKETILTDAYFSQNILRGTNLTVGFQRNTSNGRYLNAALDSWSLRTRLRYNVSDRLNVALTDLYSRTSRGVNGGVNVTMSADAFNDLGTPVNDQSSYEIRTRRDVTLAGIARLLPDSSSTTQLIGYYTTLHREFTTPSGYLTPPSTSVYTVSVTGVRLEQRLHSDPVSASASLETEKRATEASVLLPAISERYSAATLSAELNVVQFLQPSATFRQEWSGGNSTTAGGVRLSLRPGWGVSAFAAATTSHRYPTIQERYWIDSTIIRPSTFAPERLTGVHAGIRWELDDRICAEITAYDNVVRDALLWRADTATAGSSALRLMSLSELHTRGVAASLRILLDPIELTGTITTARYQENDTVKSLLPGFVGGAEAAYRNQFFDGALDLRAGVRTRFSDRSLATAYHPIPDLTVEDPRYQLGRFVVLDLFSVFRIGDAHIAVSLDNVLNISYLMQGYYPMPKRSLRLGVRWVFLD